MEPQSSSQPEEHTYLEAFILSTEDALLTMAGLTCSYQDITPVTLSETDKLLFATMSVEGEASGFVGIAMPPDLAAHIIAAIMGFDIEDLSDEDISGGVAELLNIIAGNTKARLKDTRSHFEITPPNTADYSCITEQYMSEQAGMMLRFDMQDKGSFCILVSLHEA